jgi:hypothetical protein
MWFNSGIHRTVSREPTAIKATVHHSRAGLTSVRTGSAEQGPPHIRGPIHGVLVLGKKKISKNSSKHREQTSQESITDN